MLAGPMRSAVQKHIHSFLCGYLERQVHLCFVASSRPVIWSAVTEMKWCAETRERHYRECDVEKEQWKEMPFCENSSVINSRSPSLVQPCYALRRQRSKH